ncbi:MAG: hypothetical protein Q3972_06880 [Corynebacterium sp.]|nr:hypothetical protein [Corynebacterium sp.]
MEPRNIKGPRGLGEKLYAENPGSVLVTTEPAAHLSLLRSTVEEELAFPLEQRGVPVEDIRTRIENMARALNLTDLMAKNPAMLSGGQTRRLALAAVAIVADSLLIVEDIYEGLDATTRTLVREFLHAIPVEVISITTEEEGAPETWIAPEPVASTGTLDLGPIEGSRGYRPRRLWFKAKDPEFTVGPVHLQVPQQGVLWLRGNNGAGKTTLMRALVGLDSYFPGTTIPTGYMVQNSLDQLIDPSIEQTVSTRTIPLLRELDAETHPLDLSPALQRLLQLELALTNNPPLLIADEPDVHLGEATRPAFHSRLRDYLATGGSAIISCHAPDFMAEVGQYAQVRDILLNTR